jgi:glutamine amidotransferase-like uncharacterized protein
MADKLKEGDLNAATGGLNLFFPGLSTGEALFQLFSELSTPGAEVDKRILKEIPLVGQMYYYWLGGGIEEDYDRALNREIRKRSER